MKNKIKVERAIAALTQAELAEKVQVTRQTINAIEAREMATESQFNSSRKSNR